MVIFMKKIDSTVVHETKFIALAVIFFSAVTELVFLIIGKWDYTVLLGNLLSGCAAVLNFLLMGITVQNALSKDEKSAKTAVRTVAESSTTYAVCRGGARSFASLF